MKFRTTKIVAILSTLCLQVATTPASQAATLDDTTPARYNSQIRTGAFAGARIRLAIGNQTREPKLRAGFSLAAMQSGRSARGASFARFGEGLEFGITDRSVEPQMSIAGYSLTPKRLGAAEGEQEKSQKKGRSALGTAALIAGGVLVGVAGFFVVLTSSFDSD